MAYLDVSEFKAAYAELRLAGDGLHLELREGVKAAGQEAVDAVKAAASWSSRIPAATRLKVSFSARSPLATVVTNAARAPEARPINHGGNGGTFRHPVFASSELTRDRWHWVAQKAVPFFNAASTAGDASPQLEKVADHVAFLAGFK